jgi:hypothetical protein
MKIEANLSSLKETEWYEYAARFALGGAVTVVTGLIAKRFGPSVGGLFLAFPAIFPASATLVEKSERKRKLRRGIEDAVRGRQAAALDARGAWLGSIGLAAFALIVWKLLPSWNTAIVLAASLAAWLAVCLAVWFLFKTRHYFSTHRAGRRPAAAERR